MGVGVPLSVHSAILPDTAADAYSSTCTVCLPHSTIGQFWLWEESHCYPRRSGSEVYDFQS